MTSRRNETSSGQALVEFALVAPIFFLLVFGILQLGLLFGGQNGIVDGVRDAARRAATYRLNETSFDSTIFPTVCSSVESDLANILAKRVVAFSSTRFSRTVSYEWRQDPDTSKYFLAVDISVTYRHPLYVPLISSILDRFDANPGDGSLTLAASESMRIENPPLDPPASSTTQTCSP